MPGRPERHADLLVHPDDLDLLCRHGLDSLGALLSVPGDRRLDKHGLPSWRERLVLDLDGRRLYLKRYRRPPWSEQLRRILRREASTAHAECRWLQRLDELGIAAPRVVACGCRRRGPVELESALLTAAVPGRSLERWAGEPGGGALAGSRGVRRRVSAALGRLVARLHGSGIVHRDLYLSHVFLELDGERIELSLIDLQRLHPLGLRRRRWIVKDLAALHYSTPTAIATRADRLRWFVRDYRGDARLARSDRKLLRSVLAKTRRMARHSAKHGL